MEKYYIYQHVVIFRKSQQDIWRWELHIVEPKSWKELQECLFDYPWSLTAPDRHRSPFAYRGLSEDYPDLKTSLMRIGGPFYKLEEAILRNFQKYADTQDYPGNSQWLWLSIAQHHGLPTRLLDWTYSPYVALHFATANTEKANVPGVIWCANYMKAKDFLPDKLKDVLQGRGFKFTVELLERGAKNLAQLEDLEKEHGAPFVVFIEPPSLDARIVNQYALFSLMSNARDLLNKWFEAHSEICQKIIIAADLKWEIRDNLDQSNVNERMLFPGLDGLSRWLKRYYSAKHSGNRIDDER